MRVCTGGLADLNNGLRLVVDLQRRVLDAEALVEHPFELAPHAMTVVVRGHNRRSESESCRYLADSNPRDAPSRRCCGHHVWDLARSESLPKGAPLLKCHPDWMMCRVVPHDSLEVRVHI